MLVTYTCQPLKSKPKKPTPTHQPDLLLRGSLGVGFAKEQEKVCWREAEGNEAGNWGSAGKVGERRVKGSVGEMGRI